MKPQFGQDLKKKDFEAKKSFTVQSYNNYTKICRTSKALWRQIELATYRFTETYTATQIYTDLHSYRALEGPLHMGIPDLPRCGKAAPGQGWV